jgi:hypothetical protein
MEQSRACVGDLNHNRFYVSTVLVSLQTHAAAVVRCELEGVAQDVVDDLPRTAQVAHSERMGDTDILLEVKLLDVFR